MKAVEPVKYFGTKLKEDDEREVCRLFEKTRRLTHLTFEKKIIGKDKKRFSVTIRKATNRTFNLTVLHKLASPYKNYEDMFIYLPEVCPRVTEAEIQIIYNTSRAKRKRTPLQIGQTSKRKFWEYKSIQGSKTLKELLISFLRSFHSTLVMPFFKDSVDIYREEFKQSPLQKNGNRGTNSKIF